MSYQLSIDNAELKYGALTAVSGLSLDLNKGEIACLLGPSGCGKSSLQRAIAGFEPISSGKIALAGQIVSRPGFTLNPERRHVGMVFQDFALFPHLSVENNIGFGLRKLSKDERKQRISAMLTMVGLEKYARKFPHELSGGQQQRIALARAIAPKPDILLLDEPFSSLDTALREALAKDVRVLLKDHNITAIFVTHDQQEAFAIADKVGVMNSGKLLQWDTPYQLYHKPKNRFVANFIGEGHVVNARLNDKGQLENGLGIITEANGWETGRDYGVLLRPDDLVFNPESPLKLRIKDKLFRGAEYLYQLALTDDQYILCVTPSHVDFAIGDTLSVSVDLQHVVIFSNDDIQG